MPPEIARDDFLQRQGPTAGERESSPSVRQQARRGNGYLPTLDGWRAIAILGVILYHDNLHQIGHFSTGWLFRHGLYGVDLFFAISGVLICWRLIEEEKIFGRISVRRFYIRRAFRILPPALAFLVVIGTLGITGVLPVTLHEWLCSLFLLRNYTTLLGPLHGDPYFTSHLWSLSVEEHFYFLLPSLLVFTRKHWRVPVLLGMVLLVEAHRMQVLQSRPWDYVLHHTDIRLDALLIPAIFAILLQSHNVKKSVAKWLRLWPLLLIGVLYLVSYWDGLFWQTTLVAVLMPMVVLGSMLNPRGFPALVLEWAPLRYIGRISYSLYLWQELFVVARDYDRFPLGILERTPLRYAAMLAVALASYYLLERPSIKLGLCLASSIDHRGSGFAGLPAKSDGKTTEDLPLSMERPS